MAMKRAKSYPLIGRKQLNSCVIVPVPQRRGTETRLYGGEGGIRTLDGLLTHTPLAGERLQPLGHLSVISTINFCRRDYTEKNCLANDQVFCL